MRRLLQGAFKASISLLVLMSLQCNVFGQTTGTAVTFRLQNPVNVSPNTFEYEVYMINSGTTSLLLRGYSFGVNHATTIVNSGTLTHTFLSRGASLVNIPAPTSTWSNQQLRVTTNNATAGNEALVAVGDSVLLAKMRVINSVSFPADSKPDLALQTITAAGKTQCVATCIVAGTSYAINGTANAAASGTLQALTGSVYTPCFFLNPSGAFTASVSSVNSVACFGGSNGSASIALSSTGSTGTGITGNYKVNGGANIAYSIVPFTVNNLSGGNYVVTVTTSYGCVDTANVIISAPSTPLTSSFSATACDSYILPWSATVTSSGTYSHTYITTAGCDSIVNANITINNSSTSSDAQTSCDSYNWNGNTYTASGLYTFTSLNGVGCVNTATLNLTINSSTSNVSSVTACDNYVWSVSGQTYLASGAYTSTSVNASGCIHTETLNLTVNSSTTSVSSDAACDTYTWNVNGTTYTSSGTYTSTSLNLAGCTHTSTLGLTINASTTSSQSATACDTYTWTTNGIAYTNSGTYTSTSLNISGCLHTSTLNLVINNYTTSNTTISVAGTYTWSANNVTYSTSGIYTATLVNSNGCDSIATLDLTISGANFSLSVIEDQSISCFGNADAAAQANAIGTGTYSYSIDGGPFNNTTGYFSGLSAGTHTICATDGAFTLCNTIVFVAPLPLSISFVIDSTVSCLGNDGQISAIVTGGTTNLQSYLTVWTNSNMPPDTLNNQQTNNYDLTVSSLPTGVYNLRVEDDNGCFLSSSVTLNANTPVTLTTSNTPIACAGGVSVISANAAGGLGTLTISVNGAPLAASYPSGTYTITAVDQKGCSASSVLNITSGGVLASSTSASACNSYVWSANAQTYTSTGVYTLTLTGSGGCDSTVTLNLTVNQSTTQPTQTVSACNTYTWPVNGVTYTTSGVKTATYTNAGGCDSSYTLNLTINTSTTSVTNITANNAYTWSVNGVTYTTTGVYTATSFNATGCINTATLNLTINYVTFSNSVYIDQPISCNGNNDGSIQAVASGLGGPYTYILDGNAAVNNTGFFNNLAPGTHTVCALSGLSIACATVTLTQPPPIDITFVTTSMVSCHGNDGILSAEITGGTNQLQGYLTWWTNSAGDTLNDVLTNNFALFLDSLTAGSYNLAVEDDNGCFYSESGSILVAAPISVGATFAPIVCNNGTTNLQITGSGGWNQLDPTSNLPSSPVYTSTLSYSVNGAPFSTQTSYPVGAGTYTIVAMDAKGCSNSTVVNITQPGVLTSSVSVTQCDTYTWPLNNVTYTTSGAYTTTLLSVNNCDSIVTLNLTINYSTSSSVSVTSCDSYSWLLNGTIYTTSGTYTFTSLNAVGCVSTTTLNLTINYSTNSSQTVTACNAYSWTANGLTYTSSGTYTSTSLNTVGCTQISTLNLTINVSTTSTQSVTACDNYTWSVNGQTYTIGGAYTATSTNAAGCSQTDTLNLTINPSTTSTQSETACDTYTWTVNGTTYTASGTYTSTSLNATGCTQTSTLNLTINTSTSSTQSQTACDTYTWTTNGITYTASGVYTSTSLNAAGCALTNTLNLTVNQSTTTSQSVTSCGAYTWAVNGISYTIDGTYTATTLNAAGCTQTNTLILTVGSNSNNIPLIADNCGSYTWAISGQTYTASGVYTASFQNVSGCDSSITLNLTVNTPNGDIVNTTAGNLSSVAGNTCDTKNHADGVGQNYTDNFCRLIATINDAAGGNVLGTVQACATVLPVAQVYNGQPYFARSYSISATSDGPSTITLYLTQDDFDDYNAIAGTFPTINANTSVGSVSFCVAQVPQTALPGAPGVNTIEFAATATWNAAASRWEVILPTAVTNAGYYFHACNPFNIPLPVNITRFDGHKGSSMDILEWTTSSEQNNAYFNLQHSTDGVNFTTLAKVNSKAIGGNSNTDLNYSTINPKPVLGHNYYRLQQVDLDGHTSYETRIVDLIWGAEGSSVSIYPNPATNVLNIDYLSNESINTHVKILDMSGRTVKQVLVKSQAGMNSINIDIAALADGIYTVQIFENNNLSFVQKVRKNN